MSSPWLAGARTHGRTGARGAAVAVAQAVLVGSVLFAYQGGQFPPLGTGVSPDEKASLQIQVDQLSSQVADLKRKYPSGPMADRMADVEVYLEAVRRPLKYDERLYAGRDSTPVAVALRTLATGSERAAQLMTGQSPWMTESGVRGFYSRIDGSAQPYILTMPSGYDPAAKREYRLDIFMHGRDDTVLEQQFMTKSTTGYTSKPFGPGADRFMLQPYGRYTNASRFAGEVDGLEAIESVAEAYPIDRNRIVMAGFSMGGASAWSYTVHYADRWAAAAPGAGFTETRMFLRGDLARQPQNAVQQALWHWYDATDYAVNAFNVPVVAYSGANDGQKQAADAMAVAMRDEGLTLDHIIGPNTGHSYEPGARRQLQDRLDQLADKGRNPVPMEVRFTTWTLKYNRMFWVTVDAMTQHWERARVNAAIDGDAIRATTAGVSALHLAFDPGLAPFATGARPTLTIDGTTVTLPAVARDKSLRAGLVRTAAGWKVGELPATGLRKAHGLQGPIDDAFMGAFVFVRPTGKPLSESLGTWAREQADFAISEWIHFFRAEPRVKNDTDITAADIAGSNLVLFGDPSSNAVYRRIADRLPIRWRADGVVVGLDKFSTSHAPVFVYPNPLNPQKYVVINSGFTFHDQANNAMQSPKLPDWAVVDVRKTGNNFRYLPLFVESQGFFDEAWRLKPPALVAVSFLAGSFAAPGVPSQPLHRHEASRMSMACLYAIEAYGPDAQGLPRIVDEALDEVDRIDRLMSHYKADSALSRLNLEAARHPVAVETELFDFIAEALRYNRDSGGAFDVTVGPLMKAWGFYRGEGRVPSEDELRVARGHVDGAHVKLNPIARTIAFDHSGVELDLGGIAKGYAVDRVAALLRQRHIAAALISAGGSSVYGLGAPPGRDAWDVAIQDPMDPRKAALTVRLKDRALSVAGSSEKSFEAGGVTYSHIMDPRSGRPVQGVLTVAVLTDSATAGDALDDAFFVLGAEGSRVYLQRLPGTEAMFFLPAAAKEWTLVRRLGGTH